MNEKSIALMPDFCSRRYPFHHITALNTLMKLGIDINRVDILAVGESENYKGEVREQWPAPGTPLQADIKIVLKVGCRSAVDYMPYQFFYGLKGGRTHSGEWEELARGLMAPFDASVIRHNAQSRYQTLKYNLSLIEFEHVSAFLRLFDFDICRENTPIAESIIWSTLFPFFHFWAGNPELVTRVLELIFGYKFKIIENVKSEYEIPKEIQYQLGARIGRLGRETVVGRTFSELDSGYELVIRGIKPEEVIQFLPGKPLRKKLETIISICMPNNLECHYRFEVLGRGIVVGQEKKKSYLGYATHI
ncbi:MAG: type VI secretion system baseplate subunit TssG [candidate division Zixibacteria bacterium]|nr:type VI secretion system baseplate subunit TssG [candidate division Zixibacteria bacterium]